MPPRGLTQAQGSTTARGSQQRDAGGERAAEAARARQAAEINRQRAIYAAAQTAPRAPEAAEREQAALRQLQADIAEIQRRQAAPAPMGLPFYMSGMRDVNLRNLATKLGEVAQLNPYQVPAAMQGVVRDLRGNITGFRDASGIFTGVDPFQVQNTPGEADGQMPQLTAPEPQTGRCPDGYVFDQQLNACRLVTRPDDAAVTAPPAAGTYARMGLLDQAPAGLLEFSQRYGAGFGSPQDYGAANTAFRQSVGTRPSYFKAPPQMGPEYRLL